MIKDNILYFGNGTILVVSKFNKLVFEEIDPSQPIGKSCKYAIESGKCKLTGNSLSVNLSSLQDCIVLKRHLEKVNVAGGSCIFTFDDVIFDFSNYNSESLRVVHEQLNHIISVYSIALAA